MIILHYENKQQLVIFNEIQTRCPIITLLNSKSLYI